MVVRMIVGLVLTATAFVVAGRRVWWLGRLAFSRPAGAGAGGVCEVSSGPGGGNSAD